MAEAGFDPKPYAGLHLFAHVIHKGFQAGGILGLIIAPALAMCKKKNDLAYMLRVLGISAVTGTAVSGALCTMKFVRMDEEGLQDRVYRLHYNEGQNRCDVFAQVGALMGMAAAGALLSSRGLPLTALQLAGGSAVGSALGVVTHVVSRPQDQVGHNKALHELRH